MLSSYEDGYLDIDSTTGYITRCYQESYSSSIWRTYRQVTGLAGNSSDIASIKKVYERFLLAVLAGETHGFLITNSIAGLKKLKSFYNLKGKADVVQDIEKLEKVATRVLEISQNPPEPAKLAPHANARSVEQSMIGSHGRSWIEGPLDGMGYYAFKIHAFLHLKKGELTESQRALLQRMEKTLDFGIEQYNYVDRNTLISFFTDQRIETHRAHRDKVSQDIVDYFSELSQDERRLIGILLPCGFNGKGGSHSAPVGFREDHEIPKNYILTQYDAGCGMGQVKAEWDLKNWRFHFMNLSTPFALFGYTTLNFGPYTQAEMTAKACQVIQQAGTSSGNVNQAIKAYYAVFDKPWIKKENPERRQQVVGNCTTRNVSEWIIDIGERVGEVALINELLEMGQARSPWNTPEFEGAKES